MKFFFWWWSLRIEALGKVFDAVANVVMLISCVLPAPRHRAVRDLVAKWGSACTNYETGFCLHNQGDEGR